MLEIRTTRSGTRTAYANGSYLHSPYDPGKEAGRFVRQALKDQYPSIILLLGAGIGYIYEELTRRHPKARVIALFYDETVHNAFCTGLPERTFWHPGRSESLLTFLRTQIHELEAEGLVLVEWPPSARIFPTQGLEANQAVHQLLREIRGSLVTTSALGRRWLRNSLTNFICIDKIFQLAESSDRNITVIAASGPTLKESIDFLRSHRDRIELWAVPSSLSFLLEHGLIPDMTILTDPSYYAFSHLQCAKEHNLHVAMPISAAVGSWRIGSRVSLLSQDAPFERILLKTAGIEAPSTPPQGTVSATALVLALQRRRGLVVFSGLDFCYRDIFSHARPNNFENWLEVNRLQPLHHQLFSLATDHTVRTEGGIRSNLALNTYAGWFSGVDGPDSTRIRRLHPSPTELPGITEISEQELDRLVLGIGNRSPEALREAKDHPARQRRFRIVDSLLTGWIRRSEEIAEAVAGSGALEALLSDSESLSLIFLCNAAAITEMRRILRVEGQDAAVKRTLEVMESHVEFLHALSEKFVERK
jgi:hypothetical protein